MVPGPPDSQSPEELGTHYGPGGPVEAARRWLDAVLVEGDWDCAWLLSDDVFRLCRAQAWLWNNRADPDFVVVDIEDMAGEWSKAVGSGPLWSSFAEIEVFTYRQAWACHGEPRWWGVGSQPRPVGVDTEIVLLVPGMTEPTTLGLSGPTSVPGVAMLMRVTDSWRVLNAGNPAEPTPGWPPSFR